MWDGLGDWLGLRCDLMPRRRSRRCVRFEVFRHYPPEQPISSHLAVFRHLTEAESTPPETLGDDVFQPHKSPTADKKDIGRVEGDAWLHRVLVAARRRHRGDREPR